MFPKMSVQRLSSCFKKLLILKALIIFLTYSLDTYTRAVSFLFVLFISQGANK